MQTTETAVSIAAEIRAAGPVAPDASTCPGPQRVASVAGQGCQVKPLLSSLGIAPCSDTPRLRDPIPYTGLR